MQYAIALVLLQARGMQCGGAGAVDRFYFVVDVLFECVILQNGCCCPILLWD
jgi:hypothetical protein